VAFADYGILYRAFRFEEFADQFQAELSGRKAGWSNQKSNLPSQNVDPGKSAAVGGCGRSRA
jgi:hypothetical protein